MSTATIFEISLKNHSGALSHVIGLFSRRACNVDRLLCLPSPCGRVSQLWIETAELERVSQLQRFVANLEDVVSVRVVRDGSDPFGLV